MIGQIVDFHTHILPGMDDGSNHITVTADMCRSLVDQGVTTVCATPHFYHWRESAESFLERRSAALEEARDVLNGTEIRCGAEVAFFGGISQSHSPELLCLEGTRVLLLEMPFSVWSAQNVEEVLSLLLDRGLQVVLAHPERFIGFAGNRQYLEQLADAGAAFQVNTETLLHWRTRRLGLELLQMSRTPLLGTDAHNLRDRAPRMQQGRQVAERKLGQEFLEILDEGATRLLHKE